MNRIAIRCIDFHITDTRALVTSFTSSDSFNANSSGRFKLLQNPYFKLRNRDLTISASINQITNQS